MAPCGTHGSLYWCPWDAVGSSVPPQNDPWLPPRVSKSPPDPPAPPPALTGHQAAFKATLTSPPQNKGTPPEPPPRRPTTAALCGPQVAKTKQQIEEQRAQVLVVERAQQAQLQEHEIGRRERELEATVRKPAEAERFRIERLAEAER